MKTSTGLTLVELMVTLAVFAILVAIAAPNFSTITTSNKLTATINSLAGDIAFARDRASTLGRISVAANGGNWMNGWTVTEVASGAVLRVSDPIPASLALTATGPTTLIYNTDRTQSSGTLDIRLCDPTRGSGNHGKAINVIASGRHSLNSSAPCP